MEATSSKPDLSGHHVLIVDDHKSLARGVAEVLNRAGARASLATGIEEAKALADSMKISAALVDVFLGDREGYALVGALRNRPTPTPAAMLTGFPSESVVHRAISAGAIEVLFKPVGAPGLYEAASNLVDLHVRWAAQSQQAGDTAIEPPRDGVEGHPLFDVDSTADEIRARYGLTARERGALKLMLRGRRIEEMAAALEISENTVRFHVRNVLQKLNLRSRAELLRLLVD